MFLKGWSGVCSHLGCCPCLGEEEALGVPLAFLVFFSVLCSSAVFLPNNNGGKGANQLFLSKSKKGERFVPVKSGTILHQTAFTATLNFP